MGQTTKKYVTITGEFIQTVYSRLSYSDRKKRVKCPIKSCNCVMVRLQGLVRGVSNIFGFYCKSCNSVFVQHEFNVFRLELID